MIEIGTFDELHAIIGIRGTGKSTRMLQIARDLRERDGAIVVGHSPGARFPADPLIRWHDTVSTLGRGLRDETGAMHVVTTGAPEAVLAYARTLAAKLRAGASADQGIKYSPNRPIPPGIFATPVLVLIDEGVQIDDRGKGGRVDRGWEVFLTGMRHEHVGLVWGIQRPTARSWVLLEQATDIHLYRYGHRWGLDALRAAGVDAETIARVPTLARYQSIDWHRWQ